MNELDRDVLSESLRERLDAAEKEPALLNSVNLLKSLVYKLETSKKDLETLSSTAEGFQSQFKMQQQELDLMDKGAQNAQNEIRDLRAQVEKIKSKKT